MILNLQLVKIESNYCDYLRRFDSRVPYNMNDKELRPFVGNRYLWIFRTFIKS